MLESIKQKYPVNILECFISTLVNHNALQFISLKMSPKFYLMRSSVMKCKSLVELHFENLWIEKQVDPDSLPSLRKLFLNNVRFYTTSILVSIINVSRGLEPLTLIKPHVISSACDVELSNLMELKKLILNIPWNLMMIVDFPELRAMEIHIDHGQKEGDHHFPTFLKIVFQLTNHWLGKWNWVSNVLQNCPKLQSLTIHEDSVYGDEVDDWVDPPIVPKCLSSELGTCLLKGRSCDITFAEYILKNSKAMHTMNVSAAAVDTFNKLQLIMCKKGSTTCKLSFD